MSETNNPRYNPDPRPQHRNCRCQPTTPSTGAVVAHGEQHFVLEVSGGPFDGHAMVFDRDDDAMIQYHGEWWYGYLKIGNRMQHACTGSTAEACVEACAKMIERAKAQGG